MPHIVKNDRLQPWIVCLTASLLFFYEFIQMNIMNNLSVPFMQRYSITSGQLGIFSATFFYVNALFLIPAGILLDRYAVRRLMLCATTACVLGTFLILISPSIYGATLGRIITGASNSFALLGCLKLASRWFPLHRIALVAGIIISIGILGGVVSQMPFALLITAYGWEFALQTDVALGFFILCGIYFCVKDFKNISTNLTPHNQNFQKKWQAAASNLLNWNLGLYAGLVNLPLTGLGGLWGNIYLTQVFQFTSSESATISSCLFIGMMAGSPAIGLLSDFFKQRWSFMLWGAALLALLLLPLIFAAKISFTIAMVLFFLLGFISSSQVISYSVIMENNQPIATSTAMGIASTIIMICSGLFQPLFGWVVEARSDIGKLPMLHLQRGITVLILTTLISWAVIALIKKRMMAKP